MDEQSLRERHVNPTDDDHVEDTTPLLNTTEPSSTSTMASPKEAYFEMLRLWVNQANMMHSAMVCFPYYLAANYPQLFQVQNPNVSSNPFAGLIGHSPSGNMQPPAPGDNNMQQRVRFPLFNRNENFADNQQRYEETINQNGGYEFVIAPLWKRLVAEFVDALILFIIKLMITFTILEMFDISVGIDSYFDALKNTLDEDYTDILSKTSDLLFIEVLTKIIVSLYEALWTTQGFQGHLGGATPGKMLLGLRILHVDAVVPLDPLPLNNINNTPIRALVFPANNPGFRRALVRAVAKNVLLTLIFPCSFFMLFFKNNRTGYDVMTKTVVVEENHTPTFRRR